MSSFHNKKIEDTLSELKTSDQGLTSQEANVRLQKYGENKLQEAKKTSILVRFFKQFADIMVIILVVAATISLVVSIVEKSQTELIDACIIFGIVLLNATLGTVQEAKAENALDALRKMSQPYAKVMRDGKQLRIKTTELVIGDIVILEAGDVVPADLLLIECASLKCEEASLTGESMASSKEAGLVLPEKTPLGDRKNMCFSSSTVVYGRGVGVVTATGQNAEMGKIASMLASTKQESTPLERSLNKLGKIITVLVLAIAVIIFIIDLIIKPGEVLNSFLTAVAIAVAAIPESLPAVVTIILSIGVTKLAKKNVIIRKLHAVETLGCCEVICSDKTGTITQNKMTVRELYFNKKVISASELSVDDPVAIELIKCMTLCNDAKKQDDAYIGDPTETALVEFADSYDFKKHGVEIKHRRVGEVPFDSVRKLMSTANLDGDKVFVWTKGAVDELLKNCSYIYENNKKRKITEQDRISIMESNKYLCSKALRVLGYAMSEGPSLGKEETKLKTEKISEKNLTFIGLTGMIDPPREEVFEALKKCKQAGMKAVMITGDHKDTAYAIAKELGMIRSKKQVIEGAYLDKFTDEELVSEINKYLVFTRVSPEHKVRIVKALKANGKVVAMTGDGVNDAPSIKNANIGIGMGITGTEVTKEVADMVLTDDNFATIVVAVEEGRKIFGNIQKTIQFLLGCNIAEVLAIFLLTIIYPDHTFLLPVQILFINLISDTMPAIALGVEPAEKNVMNHPPRKKDESIVGGKTGVSIIYQGITQTLIVVGIYLLGAKLYTPEIATTMAFLALNLVQMAHMFNVRTSQSIFKSNPFKNKMIWVAFGVGIALVLLISLVPFLEVAFYVKDLTFIQWLIVFGFSLIIIPIVEIAKVIIRAVERKKEKKQSLQEEIVVEEDDEFNVSSK